MSENFTREDAVAAIIAMDNPPAEPVETAKPTEDATADQAEVNEEQTSDEPIYTDDTSEDDVPGDGEEGDSQEENQEEEAAADPIDAPNWWDADAKGKFSELPPELQEIVKLQEDKREAITQKAKQQASEAQKAAEAKVRELQTLAEHAGAVFSRAEEVFKSKWDGMTPEVWSELAATDPETAFQLKLEYEAEQDRLRSVRAAQEQTSQIAQEQHYADQRAKLLEINPKLASDTNQLRSVGEYILSIGVPMEALQSATAQELDVVWKAMQYDSMMNKARAVKNTPPPQAKPTPQKSLAAAPTRETSLPPQQRELQQLKNRLAQTGAKEDLAAMFKAGAFG